MVDLTSSVILQGITLQVFHDKELCMLHSRQPYMTNDINNWLDIKEDSVTNETIRAVFWGASLIYVKNYADVKIGYVPVACHLLCH